jgi:WD40 repeat protein
VGLAEVVLTALDVAWPGLMRTLARSPGGRLLATAGRDGMLSLWDFRSGKILAAREEGILGLQAVTFSWDGKTLATGGIGRTVHLWAVDKLLTDNRPR